MQKRVRDDAIVMTKTKLLLVSTAMAVIDLGSPRAATLVANPAAGPGQPGYYRDLVDQLQPGDTLQLPSGTYPDRLNLRDLQGTASAWITITGPASGPAAVVTTNSTCCNNVQLGNTWYVAIKNLTLDSRSDAVGASIDGINTDATTHDILIENCTLVGLSEHQQTVGINTKATAWNWTIRGNTIVEPGTGMYLGYPTGVAPFIAGVIENNLIVDSIGYNIEIKFQAPYTTQAGMPADPHRTIIRNNVFMRRKAQSQWPSDKLSGARPNLLVGGFPDSGPGSGDLYEIYGNFFFMNPDEALFQASGRFSLHDNIFVGNGGTAVSLQNHDLPLKLAHVFNNTIYGVQTGIRFYNAAAQKDAVVGNLVFAATPITGSYTAANLRDNIGAAVSAATTYVVQPSLVLGQMDFYPRVGQAQGSALDLSRFSGHPHYDLDFNGAPKAPLAFRGAYAGAESNPGWRLDAAEKLGGPGAGGTSIPAAPTGLRAN